MMAILNYETHHDAVLSHDLPSSFFKRLKIEQTLPLAIYHLYVQGVQSDDEMNDTSALTSPERFLLETIGKIIII